MEKETLKILMLRYGFIDNQSLDNYIEIIYNNLTTIKEKFKTQGHHIIPVSYYKLKYSCKTYTEAKKIADKDENNFIVNVKYCDHLLLHYYMVNCCPSNILYSLSSALYRMVNIQDTNVKFCVNKYMSLEEIEETTKYILEKIDLDLYQKQYEEYLKINSQMNSARRKGIPTHKKGEWHPSPEALEKNRLAHLGRTSPCKGVPRSESTKQKLSAIMKGRDLGHAKGKIYIRKDGVIKRISPEELAEYELQGWEKGRYPLTSEQKSRRTKHHWTEEQKKEISKRNKGRKRTEEQRRHNSEVHKGKTPWNKGVTGQANSQYGRYRITNGVKEKYWKDSLGPLPEGYYIGSRPKEKPTIEKGKYRWYNNGIISTLSRECPEGFHPGRLYTRKNNQ